MRTQGVSSRMPQVAGLFGGLVLLALPAIVHTQAQTGATPVARGQETYQESCAVCHGRRGKGDGMAAKALNPPPTDLTTVSKQNRGAFPTARLTTVLKAADTTRAHSSAMMVWRALFLAEANGDSKAADARISDLLAFIESIQVK